jgi:hypothetical protein
MLHHATRIGSAIVAMAIVLVIAPVRLSATSASPISPGPFSMHLAADKSVYTVRDVIKLSLTITNNTSQTYSFLSRPPSALTDLSVVDENARALPQPSSADKAAFFGGLANYELRPGASVSPKYFYEAQPPGTVWEDISGWGYHLTKPGTYTIYAISRIDFYKSTPTGTSGLTIGEFKSNTVQIQITQ